MSTNEQKNKKSRIKSYIPVIILAVFLVAFIIWFGTMKVTDLIVIDPETHHLKPSVLYQMLNETWARLQDQLMETG